MIVLIAGSFDPITIGHIDLINKAADLFGAKSIYVAVMGNLDKKHMFKPMQRYSMARYAVDDEIDVELCHDMISDVIESLDDDVLIVRGLRSGNDYEYEKSVEAFTNMFGAGTIYLSAEPEYAHVSSSLVRNLILADATDKYKNYMPTYDTLYAMNKYIIKNKSNEKA